MLLLARDPRIKYVISNRQIFSSPAFSSTKVPWQWRDYDGTNAHTKHVHISVLGDKTQCDDTKSWSIDMLSKVQQQSQAPLPNTGTLAQELGNFEKCMQVIEKWEGAFDNDPDDPGGATNMGITRADLARWRQHPVSVDDVRNLTREEARQIFREFYWNRINGDKLPLPAAQLCLDAAVLTGVGRAGKDMQEALNRQNANLNVDGVIGPNTIAASLSADIRRLVSDFGDIADNYLQGRPGFPKFGRGWLNRLNEVRAIAADMAKYDAAETAYRRSGKDADECERHCFGASASAESSTSDSEAATNVGCFVAGDATANAAGRSSKDRQYYHHHRRHWVAALGPG